MVSDVSGRLRDDILHVSHNRNSLQKFKQGN